MSIADFVAGVGCLGAFAAYAARYTVDVAYHSSNKQALAALEAAIVREAEAEALLARARQDEGRLNEELAELEIAIDQRARLIDGMRNRGDCIVHLLGSRASGDKLFISDLAFGGGNRLKHVRGMMQDPRVWTHRNLAEVWAQDAGEAMRLLEATFPVGFGFRLGTLREVRERPDEAAATVAPDSQASASPDPESAAREATAEARGETGPSP